MKTDILILGAGSAGFAAAYRALKTGGCTVTLVDCNPAPGGTSTFGGVNCWEPGIGGRRTDDVHFEIARRLMKSGDAFVGKTTEFCTSDRRYAVSDRSDSPYEATLHSFQVAPIDERRFHFEPDAMIRVMNSLLTEEGGDRLTTFFSSRLFSVEVKNRQIFSCLLETPRGIIDVMPRIVIDCTGDIICARMAGCDFTYGVDSAAETGEKEAPLVHQDQLNGITQCFRIDKGEFCIPSEFSGHDFDEWDLYMERHDGPVSCFNVYPRGGISVNMLPTMEGMSLLNLSDTELKYQLHGRIWRYFSWLRKRCSLTDYTIVHIFSLPGIRESYRLRGKYVLCHEDLVHGCSVLGEAHNIAWADHPADIHGSDGRHTPTGEYGIPYECMLTKEVDNLMVACRGSSFSHLAASSARLSRTMLQLGEVAGFAAVVCIVENLLPGTIPIASIQR